MKRVLQDAGIRAVAGMVLIAVAGCNYSPGQPGEKQTPTTVAAAHRAAKPADNPAAHPAAAQRQPARPRFRRPSSTSRRCCRQASRCRAW